VRGGSNKSRETHATLPHTGKGADVASISLLVKYLIPSEEWLRRRLYIL